MEYSFALWLKLLDAEWSSDYLSLLLKSTFVWKDIREKRKISLV